MKARPIFELDANFFGPQSEFTNCAWTAGLVTEDGKLIEACIIGRPGCGPAIWDVNGDAGIMYASGQVTTFEEAVREATAVMLRASIRIVN